MINNDRFSQVEKIYENNCISVYKAFDAVSGKSVAYKEVINSRLNSEYANLIRNEYELLSQLDTELIVKPIELIDKEQLVLVTEFVEGKTLKNFIKEDTLSFIDKMNISLHIIAALSEVHKKMILHKDINPTNIIWNPMSEKLILLDFNISEKANSQRIEFKSPNHLQGTLQYISPEQTGRMNRVLDYRSDFYSLGITLYELFTGKVPFDSSDYLELVHSHIAKNPVSPHDLDSSISLEVSSVIMKLLSKNVEDRYQSLEGIRYDLKHINDESDFVLASSDISTRLNISQKIYGRDEIINELFNEYQKSCEGSFKHCFVSGYSGIGKTTVIQELYRPITNTSGYFLSGKFDKFSVSVPYSAIIQVIHNFIDLVFSEEKGKLEYWKQKWIHIFNESGAVLTKLVPDLELVIGKQPEVVELKGMESQNRFNHVLQLFIEYITDEKHPIVIFLDDMQWIDSASLQLLNNIFINKKIKYLYFIGAYRNNEIYPGHQLDIFFQNQKSSGNSIKEVVIERLIDADVKEMIQDTFPRLVEIDYSVNNIMRKTKGNPFFIKQVITRFYEDSCFYYTDQSKEWHIKSDCFDKQNVSDNVADFVSENLKNYNSETLQLLKVGSCLGNSFNISSLTLVMETEKSELIKSINELVDGNIILSLGSGKYMFSHDQIRQAAYSLLNKDDTIHADIALKLLALHGTDCKTDIFFEIAGHVINALENGDFDYNKKDIFEILKKAGDMALYNIAYHDALKYYLASEKLYGSSLWETDYDLQMELFASIIETSYMLGNFELLDDYVKKVKSEAKSKLHLAATYEYEIFSYLSRKVHKQAIETIMMALNDFGMQVSLDAGEAEHQEAFMKISSLMDGKDIESLLDLEEMKDVSLVSFMRLLTAVLPILFSAAPQISPLVVVKMIELSILNGNSKYSPFGYAFFGTLLCGALGDIENGYKYGQLSVKLIDKLDAISEIPKTYMLASQHIFHFRSHLDEVLDMEEEAFYKGIETGDHTYAGFAGHGYCFNYYLAGKNLESAFDVFDVYTKLMESINQNAQSLFQVIYMQTIENLQNKAKEQWILSGKWFDEFTMLESIISQGNYTALFVLYFNKMQLAYIFNEYDIALEAAENMKNYLASGVGLMHVPIYYEYSSLILLAKYDDMSKEQQEQSMEVIKSNQDYLKNLVSGINYEHRYLIVDAEMNRVNGNFDKARIMYEKAIELVNKHKYLNDECLYRELISRFFNESKNFEMENYYLSTSFTCYKRWGAVSKTNQLSNNRNNFRNSIYSNTINTLHSLNTEFDVSQSIDLKSILKFSQAMAKEIVYVELLKKMFYILLENAGASKAVILTYPKEGDVIIASDGINSQFEMDTYSDVEEYENIPLKIINYTYNSKKLVRLDKTKDAKLFSDDKYILDNDCKSLLCFPLINKAEIVGIIYLENDLSEGVFSKERTEFITLLSSQISISLDNAMVYRNLEKLVLDRTNDLEEKNNELINLNNKLQQVSIMDGLTKLYNRRKLDDVLEKQFNMYQRYNTPFSIILADVDKFKSINDTHGHSVGDDVLVSIADAIRLNTREVDFVGRWGGEEFLIICPEIDLHNASIIAEKLREAIEGIEFEVAGKQTCSFGVVTIKPSEGINELFIRVDENLYKAKELGRNNVVK